MCFTKEEKSSETEKVSYIKNKMRVQESCGSVTLSDSLTTRENLDPNLKM